jgi:hypothetical protein
MAESPPTVIITCAVLREAIQKLLADQSTRIIVMDYGLHLTPQKMRAAIQEQIDGLASPHLVLIGFGLCGNGLVGLKSRNHTLVIPCVDDCIALFFGSRTAFLREFHADPGTYYLTPGWLECQGEPRGEHLKCCEKYGPEKAALITDALYGRYRKACFIALTPEDLEQYRAQATEVAEFCRERWGWQYKEAVGSDVFIRRLLEFARDGISVDARQDPEDFVFIRPGEEVRQQPFMLQATIQEESDSCTTYTIK